MSDETIYGFNKADTSELLNLIGNRDIEYPEMQTPGGTTGGGKSGHCVLPGGAPAATYSVSTPISGGTFTNSVTPGVTGGFKLQWALTGLDATHVQAVRTLEPVSPLYNPLPIPLPNDAVVQWKENVDGFKMIDTWICGTGVAGPIVDTPTTGDPVSGGSSKSIGMGYSLEV
jgi:hypothetical protein